MKSVTAFRGPIDRRIVVVKTIPRKKSATIPAGPPPRAETIIRPFSNPLAPEVERLKRELSARDARIEQKDVRIEQLESALQIATEKGQKDSLTGLYNKGFGLFSADQAVKSARRTGKPVCIFGFDVDHFKLVNDGNKDHLFGDEVLVEIAEIVRQKIRAADIAFRFGGDEFNVILPDTDLPQALLVAERFREAVKAHSFGGSKQLKLTISGGVAKFDPERDKGTEVLGRADKALYDAKQRGRDQIVSGEIQYAA